MERYAEQYLRECGEILRAIQADGIDEIVNCLHELTGRLFIVGVGGSAATASHAVNDLRKLCGIEAYCPTDNVAELTARTNDEGWRYALSGWLVASYLSSRDAILVLSVGGGDREKDVSTCLIEAIDLAVARGAKVLGIVGRDGGYTAQKADVCIVIPPLHPERVTPHTEGICSVLMHLIVSHPSLQKEKAKWESVQSSLTATGR